MRGLMEEYISIFAKKDRLPKRQKKVCDYVLRHFKEASFMTVQELAASTEVSTATVLRAVGSLGYSSYSDFQDAMKAVVLSSTGPILGSFQYTVEQGDAGTPGQCGDIFREFAESNIKSISDTVTSLNTEGFQRIIELLAGARRIYIMGVRFSYPAAIYAYNMLNQFASNARLINTLGSDSMYDYLVDATEKDVLLAISSGGKRYGRRTVDAIRFCNENGVPAAVITDDFSNPGLPFVEASVMVGAPAEHLSLAPVITVLDALVVTLAKMNAKVALAKMNRLTQVTVDNDVII